MADFKIIKDYGVVADHDGIQLKLQLISWYGNPAKYDLRPWKDDYGMKGMVLEETSLKSLQEILHGYFKKENNDVVSSLTSLPANDSNYMSALKDASKEDIENAIKQMKGQIGNKTRISLCEKALKTETKRGRKPKETPAVSESKPKETDTKAKKTDTKPKEKIVQFPTEKPKIIELAKSNGTHTYEECEAKLNKEREMFKDQDSAYVIEGILELCKVDADFRNNVMREDKSYAGAFEYFADMARKGYCVKYGNMSYLDNDLALGLAIDYFNADCEKMKAEEKAKTGKGKKANAAK